MKKQFDKPDIIHILNREGIDLHRKGRHYKALCLFHSEKTPSLMVDTDKQRFYCFGCGTGGDSITLVMKLHGLSFKDALSYLGLSDSKPTLNTLQRQRATEDKALISAFNRECKDLANRLYDLLRRLDRLKMKARDMGDVVKMAAWLHKEPIWEYWISILEGRDERAKYEIWQGVKNGAV